MIFIHLNEVLRMNVQWQSHVHASIRMFRLQKYLTDTD
jgi:hypothetical protein